MLAGAIAVAPSSRAVARRLRPFLCRVVCVYVGQIGRNTSNLPKSGACSVSAIAFRVPLVHGAAFPHSKSGELSHREAERI